jgi:Ubiquitin fusion degradation protein UFD1
LQYVLPISTHTSYTDSMECSDKVILPLSVCLELRNINLSMPSALVLLPERPAHTPVYCSVLEFTAETDCIYVPLWLYTSLGYKTHTNRVKKRYKSGYGVNLYTLPFKDKVNPSSLPKCTLVKVYAASVLNIDEVKTGLKGYNVIYESIEIPIMHYKQKVLIKILKVAPEYICLINDDFDLEFIEKNYEKDSIMASTPLITEKKNFVSLEILPEWPEKYPKFLVDIMFRKTPKKLRNLSKKRSTTRHKPLLMLDSLDPFVPRGTPHLPDNSIKIGKKSALPSVASIKKAKNTMQNPPKFLTFNLPFINLNTKKTRISSIKHSIVLKKHPKLKKSENSFKSIERNPLEIVSQYKQIRNLT